jgi:hypothetical protein
MVFKVFLTYHMTATIQPFPVPAAKLIPWEGDYLIKGRKIKIYFDLLPGQQVDPTQLYEVHELIGTTGVSTMTVLGANIIEPKTTTTHLTQGY